MKYLLIDRKDEYIIPTSTVAKEKNVESTLLLRKSPRSGEEKNQLSPDGSTTIPVWRNAGRRTVAGGALWYIYTRYGTVFNTAYRN